MDWKYVDVSPDPKYRVEYWNRTDIGSSGSDGDDVR